MEHGICMRQKGSLTKKERKKSNKKKIKGTGKSKGEARKNK